MEFYENKAARPFSWATVRSVFILPYRRWQAARLRAATRRILAGLSQEQLKDIGMTCMDVQRFK